MEIWIDGDGCPVVDATIALAQEYGVHCTIVCDTSHEFARSGAETLTVSKGADSVDFALANRLHPGDIAVTQDYALAAMCLARGARPLRQDGLRYDAGNIDALLMQRYESQKLRRAGVRMRGPQKRTEEATRQFCITLRAMLEEGNA